MVAFRQTALIARNIDGKADAIVDIQSSMKDCAPSVLLVKTDLEQEQAAIAFEAAHRSSAGVILFDVEDAVPADDKERGREVVRNALHEWTWEGKQTAVRINGIESGHAERDVEFLVPAAPDILLLSKCQGADEVKYLDRLLTRAEREQGAASGPMRIAVLVERIRGFAEVQDLAAASPRVCALIFGPTDLGAEIGWRRSYRGLELEALWARSQFVFASHLTGVVAIDAPLVSLDPRGVGVLEQAAWSFRLGFDFKMCLTHEHVDLVNRAFVTPVPEELAWAEEILASDMGRFPYGFIKRARHIVDQAEQFGSLTDTVGSQ